MVWSWGMTNAASGGFRSPNETTVGGGRTGSVAESSEASTWPEYDAHYLKRALAKADRKYSTASFLQGDGKADDTLRQVYLNKVAANYKSEAEQALKNEFELWLQGKHPANEGDNTYINGEGKPTRRWTYEQVGGGGGSAGDLREGWRHTTWGKAALTHLPGVRDYLRSQYEEGMNDEIKMNLLAEHGPQDLQQAWMYFKHWVKGRSVSDAVPLVTPRPEGQTINDKSPWFNAMPQTMRESVDQIQPKTPVVPDTNTTKPVHVWQSKVDRAKVAADEVQARIEAGLESKGKKLADATKTISTLEDGEKAARADELNQNLSSELKEVDGLNTEMQNDAQSSALDPTRDGEVIAAQEEANQAYVQKKQEAYDLSAAHVRTILNDLDLNKELEEGTEEHQRKAILPRPAWIEQTF